MFVEQKDILAATRGGLDIILHYYPQAADALHGQKKQFKIRDERTPSATIRQVQDGTWIVTDFGGDQVSRNGIQVCMNEESCTFREAIVTLAARHNVGALKSDLNKPEFKKRPATDDEKDGEYLFDIEPEMTERQLKTLGEKVTQVVAARYNISSLKSFSYVKDRNVIETYSNDNYPIFLFDYGDFKKIYQPNSFDKAYRFRYSGTKPKDFTFGLKQLAAQYNEYMNKGGNFEDDEDDKKKSDKFPELIIASGERDALNVAGLGWPVVWFNSETATISDKQFAELRKFADRVYLLPDIDRTGVKAGIRQGLAYLDLHLIWLPEALRKYNDKRGNPRKDFSDWVELNPRIEDFKRLISTACPLRFYDVYTTEKGIKYEFNNKQMYNFLAANGFYRLENPSEKTGYSIIRLNDNVVMNLKTEKIKEFVLKYCQEHYLPVPVENMIHRTKQLGEASLVSLPVVKIDFTDYTHDSQFMFFENETWHITATEVKAYRNTEIDRFVWQNEVLPHRVKAKKPLFEIKGNSDAGFSIDIKENKSLFFKYLIQTSRVYWREETEERIGTLSSQEQIDYLANNFNIAGALLTPDERGEQVHHLVNKIFAIGYLLHRYKDKSRAWCVFAMDNKISEIGQSNGRSGKSIMMESLFHLMTFDVIGGRNKQVFENKHVFENVTEHTDYILIDDAHEYLDFDFLFDKITGFMPVNPKFNAGYKLKFEDAPKIAITSNHAVKKLDASTNDRILFTVFSDWYHASKDDSDYHETRKPIDELGKMLFGHDYSDDDWNEDLNFFAQCIQFYLSRRSPEKINPPMNNVNKRNLLASIGQNFADWASSYFDSDRMDKEVMKTQAFDDYVRMTNVRGITMNRFTRNLKDWCKLNGYTFNPAALSDKKGRIQRSTEGKTIDYVYVQLEEDLNYDGILPNDKAPF